MTPMSDDELFYRLRELIGRGWIGIPDNPGYGGTGAPGILLEELLGIRGGNLDIPDAGRWELKFHSRNSLLTLFHLEAEPRGHMRQVVRRFGWKDAQGRTSFRHTIRGSSAMGFLVSNENSRIIIRNDNAPDMVQPYWTHDRLINSFASKLRRLIVVRGRRRRNPNSVRYDSAQMYWEPQITLFADAIEKGIVAIDFDARTNNGDGLRNHGTKFRISYDNLSSLYHHHRQLDS